MKRNLSSRRIKTMYHSLAKEAWDFWQLDKPIPPIRVSELWSTFWGGTTEDHFDGAKPSLAMAQTNFPFDRHNADHIVVNAHYTPYLYEDEMICVLLHELAHAHVGIDHQHNEVWAKAAEEIGAFPEPVLVPRSLVADEIKWLPDDVRTHVIRFNLSPTLG